MNTKPNKKILVVDDDHNLRKTLCDILEAKGYVALESGDGAAALHKVEEDKPDVALIDLKLGDMSGLDVIETINKRYPGIKYIVLTGHACQESAIEAVNLGAYAYIKKPYEVEQLLVTLHRAIEKQEAEKALVNATAQWRTTFDSMQDQIMLLDSENNIIRTNKSMSVLLGLSYKEMLGRKCYEVVHGTDAPPEFCPHAKTMDDGKEHCMEYLEPRLKKHFTVNITPYIDESGKQTGVIHVMRDITARKKTEDESAKLLLLQDGVNLLQQSLLTSAPLDRKLKSITDSIVQLFDADFCRIWLIRPGDLCEKGCIHAEVREGQHVCRYRECCLHLLSSSGRYTHIDGKVHRRVPFGCYKIGQVASGKEHKFFTNDVKNDPRVHDHEWARNLGLVSFAGYQLCVPGMQSIGVMAVFSKHPLSPEEEAMLDGLSSATALVVQQAKSEEAQRESEELYRSLVENVDLGITLIDLDHRVLMANSAVGTMLGVPNSEIIGKNCFREFEKRDKVCSYCPGVRSLASLQPEEVETEGVRNDGSRFNVRIRTFPVFGKDGLPSGFIEVAQDITENKKMEAQLNQSQRMEAIGRLAGGIAHDFNNILSVIISYSGFVTQSLDPTSSAIKDMEEINQAAWNATGLTRQLLAFSSQQPMKPEVIDINNVVIELESMLQRIICEDIEFKTVLCENLGKIIADPSQIQQVIMNLVVNAGDSMPKGGKLTIETLCVELDKNFMSQHGSEEDIAAGQYIMIAVSDTGYGMSEEVREHIFEPFYSTKSKDKGTGLGLATVYGVVKQNKGLISVYSEPDIGSTFKVFLPVTDKRIKPDVLEKSSVNTPSRNETILIVEDNEKMLVATSRILSGAGYTVIEACSPAVAEKRFKEANKIDLLLTDVIMPETDGRELSLKLKNIHADLKVLYMSGYTNQLISQHGVLEGSTKHMQKPFSKEELLKQVRKVLNT